jgi:hypothetical protein
MGRLNSMKSLGVASILIVMSGCATTQSQGSDEELDAMLGLMLSGQSQVQGAELDNRLEEASAYPLGSRENPVRAQGPAGQRAYLARLRCADVSRPDFYRAGSAGVSPYGNIVDVYIVTCSQSEPAKSEIFIDMYHRGYVENRAVPGYGIVGGTPAE